MTKKQIEGLLKTYLPELLGYTVKGDMLYAVPVKHVLKGIVLDRSTGVGSFYAHVFVQPLYVPTNHLVLSLGWRLGGGSRVWCIDSLEERPQLLRTIKAEGIPFLNKIQGPEDVIWAAASVNKPGDMFIMKALAYSFARIGDVESAIKQLEELIRFIGTDLKYDWQKDTYAKASLMKKLLLENLQKAQQLLDEWERFTARALKLEV